MANYIEKTNIDPKRFVTPSSRYASSTVLYYTENRLLAFETYKKNCTKIPFINNLELKLKNLQ